jgi:hypothetical protein
METSVPDRNTVKYHQKFHLSCTKRSHSCQVGHESVLPMIISLAGTIYTIPKGHKFASLKQLCDGLKCMGKILTFIYHCTAFLKLYTMEIQGWNKNRKVTKAKKFYTVGVVLSCIRSLSDFGIFL